VRLQTADDIVLKRIANIRAIIHTHDGDIMDRSCRCPAWMQRALDMRRGTGRDEGKQEADGA
jgi:hypothetical protein